MDIPEETYKENERIQKELRRKEITKTIILIILGIIIFFSIIIFFTLGERLLLLISFMLAIGFAYNYYQEAKELKKEINLRKKN